MGVRGLTTFINNNQQQLLTDFKLCDTKLIIDGGSLYHFLYYYYEVAQDYGGDYDHFSSCCESFFKTLLSRHIKPYVVFDGIYANEDRFKIIKGRAQDRIQKSQNLKLQRILPILARDVFCSTLNRLKVPHVKCDYEADPQIAALANEFGCPVLTNDSDFFLFQVEAGVISLDYLPKSHELLEESCSDIKVRIFKYTNLMKMLNKEPHNHNYHSLIALFVMFLGNDEINSDSESKDIRNSFKYLNKLSIIKSRTSRQDGIVLLVEWLKKVDSASNAIGYVLSEVPPGQLHDNIFSLFEKSRDYYTIRKLDPGSHSCLYYYFKMSWDSSATKMRISRRNGNPYPKWFKHQIQSSNIPTSLIGVIVHRCELLSCQVEQLEELSSYLCSRPIRRAAYGIVLSLGLPESGVPFDIVEYDREKTIMTPFIVKPLRSLDGRKPLPNLGNIRQIEVRERFQIIIQLLGSRFDETNSLPFDVELLVSLVRYWILHAYPMITRLHVVALVLCFLKLGALDKFVTLKYGNQSEWTQWRELSVTEWLKEFKVPYETNGFERGLVHTFCQFQTCLKATGYLIKLLCLSKELFDLNFAFNGTVLYNIVRKLREENEPDAYIAGKLGETIFKCYNDLFQIICNNLNLSDERADVFDNGHSRSKTRHKRAQKQIHQYGRVLK